MILLYNSYDSSSRDFLSTADLSIYSQVIDWNVDLDAQAAYLAAGGPHPSSFPMEVMLPPQPNLAGFKNQMVMDQNIPVAAKMSVFTFAAVLTDMVNAVQTGADPAAVLQGVWAEIKATDPALSGMCNDGTTLITTQIEAYSTQFNIGLV